MVFVVSRKHDAFTPILKRDSKYRDFSTSPEDIADAGYHLKASVEEDMDRFRQVLGVLD